MPASSSSAIVSTPSDFRLCRSILRRWPKPASVTRCKAFESQGSGTGRGVNRTTDDVIDGGGTKACGATSNNIFASAAPARQHRKAAIGIVADFRDNAFGHFALEHQQHRIVPGRPWLGSQPTNQQRGADIIGQVGDDAAALGTEMLRHVYFKCVTRYDVEAAGIARGYLLQSGDSALVALDGDDPARAQSEQSARQPARTGAYFDNRDVFKRLGGARDTRGQIQIVQEILSERLLRRQPVLADDLAQRRQVVDLASCAAITGPLFAG